MPIPDLTAAERARFFAKVERSGDCLLWRGACSSNGYGNVSLRRRNYPAHRVAYAMRHGDPGEWLVLHSCDTPLCVEPDHLFLGDYAANMQDAKRKGRHRGDLTAARAALAADPRLHARGPVNGRSRLTDDDVSEIRRLYHPGNASDLALRFGVRRQTIWRIATNRARIDIYDPTNYRPEATETDA